VKESPVRESPAAREHAPPEPEPRQGPRPLALHLAISAMACMTSSAAWPSLRRGSLDWNASLAARGTALVAALENADPDAFADAVAAEAAARYKRFLGAVDGYRKHPYRRTLSDPPALWREGSTRVLDYRGTGEGAAAGEADMGAAPPVLMIPSLINRAYVLDLSERRSLARHLAGQGLAPFLVDWGAPGEVERGFGLDEYILGRLMRAVDAVKAATGHGRVTLMGYCMGGLLALPVALARPDEIAGLALLATPWDFHCDGGAQARFAARVLAPWLPFFTAMGGVPVDVLQMLFASLDPCLALKKFLAFSDFAPDSPEAEAFVALEDWLNDGVELAPKVAEECLVGWYGENRPGRGAWRVGGTPVRPDALGVASLVVVPESDRIVPPGSARALAALMPAAQVIEPRAGHIGMVVGGRAVREAWAPLAKWLAGLQG
jgi:polyhydroxyalkanoate synthase